MKALLWKELREAGLWTALIGLGLCTAQGFALYSTWRQYLPPGGSTQADPIAMIDALYGNYKLWMAIGAPVAGFAIGMLQILPEQRREEWAFLVHRPISLPTLFWAKAIAGILAYAAATFIPLSLFTLWLLMPGHFPGPFSAILALPNIASILVGAAFYFAGLTVALRPARWWGSKLLPLVAAICAALLVANQSEFAAAALWSSLAIAIVGAAAYGSFVSFGQYEGMRTLARIALGTTLLVGATAVVGGAYSAIIAQVAQNRTASSPSTEIEITDRGRLVQPVVTDWGRITRVLDALGRPIPNASTDDSNYTNGTSVNPTAWRFRQPYSAYERYFGLISGLNAQTDRYTFYDYERRLISIFSVPGLRFAGFVGRNARFTASSRDAERFPQGYIEQPFPVDGTDRVILPFRAAIYTYDERLSTVSLFAAAPNPAGFGHVEPLYLPNRPLQDVLAGAGDDVIVYDRSGRTVARFSLRQGGALYGDAVVYVLQDPTRIYALLQGYWMSDQAKYSRHQWLYEQVGPSGPVGAAQRVVPQEFASWESPSPAKSALSALGIPIAVVAGFAAGLAAMSAAVGPGSFRYGFHAYIASPTFCWITIWAATGGIICAVAMILLGRRYGRQRKALSGWTATGFLLSWPGLLMVLAMIPFPPLSVCGSCGQRRRLDRETCEHCGAAQPLPTRDGTEIFETATGPLAIDPVAVSPRG